jgi:hypothetical protein
VQDFREVLRELSGTHTYQEMAKELNHLGFKTGRGKNWTAERTAYYVRQLDDQPKPAATTPQIHAAAPKTAEGLIGAIKLLLDVPGLTEAERLAAVKGMIGERFGSSKTAQGKCQS